MLPAQTGGALMTAGKYHSDEPLQQVFLIVWLLVKNSRDWQGTCNRREYDSFTHNYNKQCAYSPLRVRRQRKTFNQG